MAVPDTSMRFPWHTVPGTSQGTVPNYNQFPTRPWKEEAYRQPVDRGPELRNAPTTIPSLISDALQWGGVEGKGVQRYVNKLDELLNFSPHRALEDASRQAQAGDVGQAAFSSLGFLPLAGVPKLVEKFRKKPPGTLKTVLLHRGSKNDPTPVFGVVDESDNSLATLISGQVSPATRAGEKTHYGVHVAAAQSPRTHRQADELYKQGEITETQLDDFREGPAVWNETSSDLTDELLLRGISGGVGDAVRSGTAFGRSARGIMDTAAPMVLSKPLREAEGNIYGSRITGAKSRGRENITGGSLQAIPMPKLRERAIKKGVKPAEDVSIPGPFMGSHTSRQESASERFREAINMRKKSKKQDEELDPWDDVDRENYGEDYPEPEAGVEDEVPFSDDDVDLLTGETGPFNDIPRVEDVLMTEEPITRMTTPIPRRIASRDLIGRSAQEDLFDYIESQTGELVGDSSRVAIWPSTQQRILDSLSDALVRSDGEFMRVYNGYLSRGFNPADLRVNLGQGYRRFTTERMRDRAERLRREYITLDEIPF